MGPVAANAHLPLPRRLSAPMPNASWSRPPARSTGTTALSLSVKEANALLLGVGIALNKTEFENAFDHFPGACDLTLDVISFSEALGSPVSTGAEPRFFNSNGVAVPRGEARSTFSGPGCTPHSKHLGLSGTSHIDFGTQHKPFPAHWGVPPNVAMKGQHGIMRDLASGYGKGNGPLEKWVLEHIEQAIVLVLVGGRGQCGAGAGAGGPW